MRKFFITNKQGAFIEVTEAIYNAIWRSYFLEEFIESEVITCLDEIVSLSCSTGFLELLTDGYFYDSK